MSRDPLVNAELLQGANLYRYVSNNPVNWIDSLGLSTDSYVPDNRKHGDPHVDRYTKNGQNVGRYNKDGSGIRHQGKWPPAIPNKDWGKFLKAAEKLLSMFFPLFDDSSIYDEMKPVYDQCGNIIDWIGA